MRELYKYSGTISSFSVKHVGPENYPIVDMILSETLNDKKPPVRLEAHGGLAKYIEAIEGTDAEERYIACDWYYDNLLFLRRIEVPSSDPLRPAKIIAQLDFLSRDSVTFGPEEYIETSEPDPMDREQYHAWLDFHRLSMDKTNWK